MTHISHDMCNELLASKRGTLFIDKRGRSVVKKTNLLPGLLREKKERIADLLEDLGISVRRLCTKLLETMEDARNDETSEAGKWQNREQKRPEGQHVRQKGLIQR